MVYAWLLDQWGWDCGFYPRSHSGRQVQGTAETFEQARADFEAAWKEYLPKCSETDFDEYRRQRAWTSWRYAMWGKGCTNQAAIAALFRVVNQYVGNLRPMPGVFPDYPAPSFATPARNAR
jgi:hypothetical protein